MTLDSAILASSILLEAVVIWLLLRRQKAWQRLPLLCVYLGWALFSDIAAMFILWAQSDFYPRFYVGYLFIDAALHFALLVELMRSVLVSRLNPQEGRPRWSWTPVIASLLALSGWACWLPSGLILPEHFSRMNQFFFQLQTTMACLRMVCFVAMLFSRSSFSIGSTATAMQVSAGFAFYSTISLLIQIAHSHETVPSASYHFLDQLVSLSYVVTLAYWARCFSRTGIGLVPRSMGD